MAVVSLVQQAGLLLKQIIILLIKIKNEIMNSIYLENTHVNLLFTKNMDKLADVLFLLVDVSKRFIGGFMLLYLFFNLFILLSV